MLAAALSWSNTAAFARRHPAVMSACCAAVAGLAGLALYIRLAPLPAGALLNPSRVAAAGGSILGDLVAPGVTRTEVPLIQIPLWLQKATLAVEDNSFYEHRGLNARGIARALLADLAAGRVVQGGSTITQQLAKNLFLTNDRTLWRKAREVLYALMLEAHLSKPQILADYLNVIYYGDGAVGAGTAAEYYFGKPVGMLNLAESALLAGLPKGPSLYSPIAHPAAAKVRQHEVLQAMVHAGSLSPAAARAAFAQPLHFVHRRAPDTIAPYFMNAVSQEAQARFDMSQTNLYRSGMLLHTTLDPRLQQALNQSIAHAVADHPGLQAAGVAMDVHTGDILAYSGGRDYRTSPFDRVRGRRQPGSTFKPFVYAAALDRGATAAMHMRSEPRLFVYDRTHLYRVHNFADDYAYADIDMKQALARSDNVFAVATNLRVHPWRVMQEAKMFGLPDNMKPYPSLALGVFPVSPLELARAYAVFANGGYLVTPRFIADIRNAAGQVVKQSAPLVLRVAQANTCYILTDMMQSVMKAGGTGYRVAHLIPGPVAAKTGTTDSDAWMAGYTPDTVCAVWVGYDDMRPLSSVEAHLAAPIFASVMRAAWLAHPQGAFTRPGDITELSIDPETGQCATSACPAREMNAFVNGTEPTVACLAHPAPDTSLAARASGVLRAFFSWIRGR